jgi:hypothetical protein
VDGCSFRTVVGVESYIWPFTCVTELLLACFVRPWSEPLFSDTDLESSCS